MKSAQYQYSDGSGNTYKMGYSGENSFEYIPVKPAYSSSGEYDGGNPVSKNIPAIEMNKIVEALNTAIKNPSVHIQNRIKGSGMIVRKQNDVELVIIIKSDSAEKDLIETILKELIK